MFKALKFKFSLLSVFGLFSWVSSGAQAIDFSDQLVDKVVVYHQQTTHSRFVNNSALHSEHWDTLAQPQFWMDILSLSPDSCIINIASCRKPLQKICLDEWNCQ